MLCVVFIFYTLDFGQRKIILFIIQISLVYPVLQHAEAVN